MKSKRTKTPARKTFQLSCFLLIFVGTVLIFPSCREKKASEKTPAVSSPQTTRSHDRTYKEICLFYDVPEPSSDLYAAVNLIKATDSELIELSKKIIDGGNLTPETENADRLERCISQLARRNSAALYEVISALPPGYYSESFVSSTFMRHQFASFAEAVAKAEPIKESDLYRAALAGALSNYTMSPGQMSLGLDIPRLRDLKGNGLNDEQFSKLVIFGVASGDFELPSALAELNLDSRSSNIVMIEIVRRLPTESVKTVFAEVRSRGLTPDLASLLTFASSYAEQDSEAAIAWAAQLPEKEAAFATRSMFYEWTAAEPMKASARIATMEAGPLKDAAIEGLIRNTVANGAIEEAQNWTATIQNEALRNRMTAEVAKSRNARQIRK
ncbi:MAG: hypothetical protein V4640_05375 [Verrucomicrobiota bacterium]